MLKAQRVREWLDRFEEFREKLPDTMVVVRARARKLPSQTREWARRNWIALWLVPQAVISITLFFHGAGALQTPTDLSGVATVEGDGGSRRERGEFDFKATERGTVERDWEGLSTDQGSSVPFRIARTRYVLEPGSVVVFRAPFLEARRTEDRFRILKGRVSTDDHQEVKYQPGEDQTREIPKVTGERVANTIRAKIYPRIDSHLLVSKPGLATIAFSWSHPRTGYVAVLAVESDQVSYFPIDNADHVHAPILTDRSYAWQIVSKDREILEGPFRFQLASGGPDAWRKALLDPSIRKDKGGVDILLDE